MNHEAILALISELYLVSNQLRQENAALRTEIEVLRKSDVPSDPTRGTA